jgi:hypothetical protein
MHFRLNPIFQTDLGSGYICSQHVYESHKIFWKEAKVLQIEPNTTYRKHKQSAHMSLVDHPISQPNLDISSIWTPVIAAEVRKLQLRPV